MIKERKLVKEYRKWRELLEDDRAFYTDITTCHPLPLKIQKALRPCPKCGEYEFLFLADPYLNSLYGCFFVECLKCEYEGPMAGSESCAFAAWGITENFDTEEVLIENARLLLERKGRESSGANP